MTTIMLTLQAGLLLALLALVWELKRTQRRIVGYLKEIADLRDKPTEISRNAIVLQALKHLGRESSGLEIKEETERLSGGFVSIGGVYAALDRLERQGAVISRLGGLNEDLSARGGRRRKYFQLVLSGGHR